jgi:hypothetical protein
MDSDAMVMVGVRCCPLRPPAAGRRRRPPAVSSMVPQSPANSSMFQQWSRKFQQIPAKSRNVRHAGRAGPCWTMLDHLLDTHTRDRTSHDSTKKEKKEAILSRRAHITASSSSPLTIFQLTTHHSHRAPHGSQGVTGFN